jgi:hypothetical protein
LEKINICGCPEERRMIETHVGFTRIAWQREWKIISIVAFGQSTPMIDFEGFPSK